ncbi:hypothetical protein JRQ81_013285, partial [Phrynocephalus forsythii]
LSSKPESISLARHNVMPSDLLWGKFGGITLNARCGSCEQCALETLVHMVLYCPVHHDLQPKHLAPILQALEGKSDLDKIHFMLIVDWITSIESVADFLSEI